MDSNNNMNVNDSVNPLTTWLESNQSGIAALVAAGFTLDEAKSVFAKKYVSIAQTEAAAKVVRQNEIVERFRGVLYSKLEIMSETDGFMDFISMKPSVSLSLTNDNEILVDIKLGAPIAGKVSRSNADGVREATNRSLLLNDGETVEMRIQSLIGTSWKDANLPSQYKQFLCGGNHSRTWNYVEGYYGAVLVDGVIVAATPENCATMIAQERQRSIIRDDSYVSQFGGQLLPR